MDYEWKQMLWDLLFEWNTHFISMIIKYYKYISNKTIQGKERVKENVFSLL